MKRVTLFVVAVALMSTLAFGANKRSEIRAVYKKLQAAYARNDGATIAKFLAKDYVATGPDGKVVMNRAQRIADLKRQFLHFTNVMWTPRLTSFKDTAQGTVVALSTHMTATLVDPKGGKHSFVFDGKSQDTWAKGKHGWQEVHVKVLSGGGTMDGHPMGGPPSKGHSGHPHPGH